MWLYDFVSLKSKSTRKHKGAQRGKLVELFCKADDFCGTFRPEWEKKQLEESKGQKADCGLSYSEIMTLIIYFHQIRF